MFKFSAVTLLQLLVKVLVWESVSLKYVPLDRSCVIFVAWGSVIWRKCLGVHIFPLPVDASITHICFLKAVHIS